MADSVVTESTPHSAYLFVSYASADRDRVLPIIEHLEAAGIPLWIDRVGIPAGANYGVEIAGAIEGCAALLIMCTAASFASRNVKQEIALAWRFERPYLPVLLEPVEVPKDVSYWLVAAQWVEVLDKPAEQWLPAVMAAAASVDVLPTVRDTVGARKRPLMVGREQEQAELRRSLDQTIAGEGGLVVIAGEAGIGKTVLIESFTIDAEERGCVILRGNCYDLSVTPPYGPWIELANHYHPTDGLPNFPSFLRDADALAALGSQQRLFADVTAFFVDLAERRPVVLILDDLHWADTSSLDLLRYLSHEVASHPLLVVVTYRIGEISRNHPLYRLLPLLTRESRATRMTMKALGADALRKLISARYVLPENAMERLEMYLRDHSEGNPLYATELLRTLEDDGTLTVDDGIGQLGNLDRVSVPPLLWEVIEGRVGHLREETQQLLPVAAIIGPEVSLELWGAVSRAGDEAVLDAVEEAVTAHILLMLPNDMGVRFSHALIRQALYDGVLPPRRRIWHLKIAEMLDNRPQPDPDVIAFHYQRASDARAIPWLIRAAHRAEQRFAWQTAVQRYETTIEAIMREPEIDHVQRCEVLLALGAAQHLAGSDRDRDQSRMGAGDVPVARATFERAAEAARAAHSPDLLGRAALGFSGISMAGQGGAAEASLLAEALAALSADESVLRLRVHARLIDARWWLALRWGVNMPVSWAVWVAELQASADEAVAIAKRIDTADALFAALNCKMMVITGPTTAEQQLVVTREIIGLAEQRSDVTSGLIARHFEYLAMLQKGHLVAAAAAHQRLTELATTLQIPYFMWLVTTTHVSEALQRGDLAAAENLIAEADRLWPNSTVATQQLFTLRREQGRAAEVTRQIVNFHTQDQVITVWTILEVLIRIESGTMRGIRETVRTLVSDWIPRPQGVEWLRPMSWLAEAVAAIDDAEPAAALYATLAPFADLNLAMATSDHVGGSIAYYLGLLAGVTRHWPEADLHFRDAYARNSAWGSRLYRAHTAYAWAESKIERGINDDDTRALLDDAEQLSKEMGSTVLADRCRRLRERLSA